MQVYWREYGAGQRLVVLRDDGKEVEVGFVKPTAGGGYTVIAKAEGAQEHFPTMEQAKAFAESFRPWQRYTGYEEIEVDAEVRPSLAPPPATSSGPSPEDKRKWPFPGKK